MAEALFKSEFQIEAGNFVTAGEASASIKRQLRQLGVDAAVVRNVAIAAYECELNMVIHSTGGRMSVEVLADGVIRIHARDSGPGIQDIQAAMKEGFSTATEEVWMMGFGAGMGLPNMRRCSDELHIESSPEGTEIEMKFYI